jgi:tRNA(Leu) C34 or U34 (ribose-2'-O)-methylase TrmL
MKKVSDKQRKQNAIITKVKQQIINETGNVCRICGNYGNDLAHLLPKGGMYCQYKLEPRNMVILCRKHHDLYDNDISFRKQQTSLISQCREFALDFEISNYFQEETESDKISNMF